MFLLDVRKYTNENKCKIMYCIHIKTRIELSSVTKYILEDMQLVIELFFDLIMQNTTFQNSTCRYKIN